MSEHGQGPDPSRGPDGARREGQAEYFGHGSEPRGIGQPLLQVAPPRPAVSFLLAPHERLSIKEQLLAVVRESTDDRAIVAAADILTREHPF